LAWSAPSAGDAPILFYRLVATKGSSSSTTLYDASTNSASLSGLTNGSSYSLSVTAVSSLGAGQASSPVSLTPRTVPSAPKNSKATAGTKKVTLSWILPSSNGGSAITGYKIYKGTSAGHESATPMNASLVTSLTFSASSLKTGTKYYFVIRAVNVAGISVASVEVSATAK
jgi:predicted phage tail protein